jgi:hypothetical protein
MTDVLAWPDWLTGISDRERLHKILAAVHRCYMEHEGETVPTGPHMTISMAEHFIAQMANLD